MADVEVIEGSRKGAKYHVFDQNVYVIDKTIGDKKYLRCVHHKTGCPGTAVVIEDVGHTGNAHNHPVATASVEDLRLRRRVLQAAVEKAGSLRQIFNEAVRGEPGNARLTFEMMEVTMQRRRRELLPPIPAEPEHALECIERRVYPRYSK